MSVVMAGGNVFLTAPGHLQYFKTCPTKWIDSLYYKLMKPLTLTSIVIPLAVASYNTMYY